MPEAKNTKPSKIGGYTPTQELGSGAMGKLWLCHDKSLDRMVVVKQMPGTVATDIEVIDTLQFGTILRAVFHLRQIDLMLPYS